MIKTNEKNFVKRLKSKKEDALEWTYDKYIGFVKRIVYDVLNTFNNNGVIEECINDIFMGVWNNIDKFTGDNDDFRNWIGAIAKFKSIDYHRRLIKNCEDNFENIDIAHEKTIEDEILEEEDRKEILNILNELEEIDKKIFIMKYFMGMKCEDIGVKLNLTKSAVDSKLYRGRKKLKKKAAMLKLEVI